LSFLKAHTKQFLEIGAFYLVALIVVDFLLRGYPVLTWLTLAAAFAIFSTIIIGTLYELAAKKPVKPIQPQRKYEDELAHIERLTKNVLEGGDVGSTSLLSERLKLTLLSATALHLNLSNNQLSDMIEHNPRLIEERLDDPEVLHALTSDKPLISPGDARSLQDILSKMENWLS